MTNLTQFKKLAKTNLTTYLTNQGFEQGKSFMFYKKGPEDIYYVLLFNLSYGENLKVSALCHTKEMDKLIPQPFPESVSLMVGGMLKPGEPIAYENGYVWDVKKKTDALAALIGIQKSISDSAFPFFESITDRKKLVNFIYPSMRVDDYARVIEKILLWKPDN